MCVTYVITTDPLPHAPIQASGGDGRNQYDDKYATNLRSPANSARFSAPHGMHFHAAGTARGPGITHALCEASHWTQVTSARMAPFGTSLFISMLCLPVSMPKTPTGHARQT
jgi:hypothetical protein